MVQSFDEQRALILDMVQKGDFSAKDAETWAINTRSAPFARGPEKIPANPIEYQQWTLPMAAAWFIWRSPIAVLHQSAEARVNWKRWIIIEPAKYAFFCPKCGVVDIGPATLWDVFYESRWDPRIELLDRFKAKGPAARAPDPKTDYPYARLRNALRAGTLVAMRSRAGKSTAEGVPQDYWRENFDRLAQPQRAQQRPEEEEFFFQPEAVIKAETEIAAREFETPFVGLEQALGWVAYRNEGVFRSLSRADLNGRTYCGQRYEPDFQDTQPEKELFEFLAEGEIKGYRGGMELSRGAFSEMTSVWDAVDLKFARNESKKAWVIRPIPLVDKDARDPPARVDISPSNATMPLLPPKRRRGPDDDKYVAVRDQVKSDLRNHTRTIPELLKMKQKEFERSYGCKPNIVQKVRRAIRAAPSEVVDISSSDK